MKTVKLKRLALFVAVAAVAAIAYTQGYYDRAEVRGFTLLPDAQAGGQAPTDGKWVHYAITYSRLGHISKLFINGEHAAFLKRPLEKATGAPRLVFGVSGILDDVALYDTTLNIDEVWAVYNSPTGAAGVAARIPVDPYMSRGYRSDFIRKYMPEPTFEYQNKGFAAANDGNISV